MVEAPRAPDEKRPPHALPLYVQILIGLALGVVAGLLLGPRASAFDLPTRLILRLLGALAPVLILVAVVRAIMTAEIHGRLALRMVGLLVLNTLMAIGVGLAVANVLRPGAGVARTRAQSPRCPGQGRHRQPAARQRPRQPAAAVRREQGDRRDHHRRRVRRRGARALDERSNDALADALCAARASR